MSFKIGSLSFVKYIDKKSIYYPLPPSPHHHHHPFCGDKKRDHKKWVPGRLKGFIRDICLGGLLYFLSKKIVKQNMAMKTLFEMLILLQPSSNQVMFSYVTHWFY